jgi:23S rRNA pseudouridine1911/1915/1917 synthase
MLLIITEENQLQGKRLDNAIFTNSPKEVSRGSIQEQIENGEVRVNNKKIRKNAEKVKLGDRIVIHFAEQEPEYIPDAEDIPLDILFENNDLIIISKPSGMCTHPDNTYKSGTVVNAIMGHLNNHQKEFFDEEKIRPGIVHRLDKDTSGCLMVAKNKKTHRYLSKIIAERKVTKRYQTLVLGRVSSKKGIINSPITRDPNNRERMTTLKNAKSKEALTHFECVAQYPEPTATLVNVNIITGRTHQIRVHFSAIGHPVYGDNLYGNPKDNSAYFIKFKTDRMFLHAKSLSFPLENGEIISIESPLPSDLQNIVNTLEQSAKNTSYL